MSFIQGFHEYLLQKFNSFNHCNGDLKKTNIFLNHHRLKLETVILKDFFTLTPPLPIYNQVLQKNVSSLWKSALFELPKNDFCWL